MSARVSLPLLDRVTVASPCSARWEDMVGDERSRVCGECTLRVHNLSALTSAEAEELLGARGAGRLCVRFYQRPDGTVLTQDCPRGLAALRARARRAGARVAAALGLVVVGSAAGGATGNAWERGVRLRELRPLSLLVDWLFPAPAPPVMGNFTMGEVAPPPTGSAAGSTTRGGLPGPAGSPQ